MTRNVVKVILEPGSQRQLGEEGLLVFWRDGHEPGLREGLAFMLSVCPQPDCPCDLVHVDGFVIEGQPSALVWDRRGLHQVGSGGRVTLEARMFAIVDPSSGETRTDPDHPGETDPALVEWLVSQMDGELLDVLYRYWSWSKRCRPEGPRAEFGLDLDELLEQHLVDVDALLDGTRPDEYVLGDGRYWAGFFLCPARGCDCHEAGVVFFDDLALSGDAVGSVHLEFSEESGLRILDTAADRGPKELLEELWALFEQRHDVARFLRHREAQMKSALEVLRQRVPKPAAATPKVGRNAPCPCGSGRKHKQCCLGKDVKLSGVVGSAGGTDDPA